MVNPSSTNWNDKTNDNSKNLKLKGKKRKKVLPKCANPLFVQWLTEWKEEAASKGWKSQYQYAKAVRTLKLFPLTLETGKDCKMLQNFGDKICKMLDEKLAEHKENESKEIQDDDHFVRSPVPSSTSALSPGCALKNQSSASTTIHAISDNSESEKEEMTSPQKKKKRKSSGVRSREYIPAYRSGPYALILIMYRYSQDPDYKGFLTKAELMHAAQPLADKSFTLPDAGSHYTAWSSMGNLIKRGFVAKSSSPSRFSLTPEGCNLGERLENVEIGNSNAQPETVSDDRCNLRRNSSPSSLMRPTTNSNDLERVSCNKEKDLNSQCVSETNNASSTISFDDPVLILSDEEVTNCNVRPSVRGGSNFSCAHSLSPSSSVASSPSHYACERFDFPTIKSSDVACLLQKENKKDSDDSISVVECEGIEDDDDEVNITGVSYTTPPKHSRLPSLSPPVSLSEQKHEDDYDPKRKDPSFKNSEEKGMNHSFDTFNENVIEIVDDDDVGNENDNVCNNLGQRKNIFELDAIPISQSSQSPSDDDDLPDLDFCVPLSKRLLAKGNINSQLLFNHLNKEQEKPQSSGINSNYLKRPNGVPPSHCKSKDTFSEPSKPFTSIITKTKDVDQTRKTGVNVVKSILPTNVKSVCELERDEVSLETQPPPPPQFTLLPGTFDIVLCIDNREFYGSKSNSKTLLPDLMQSGVNCDLRLLHIGDILWVAREKGSPNEDPSRSDRKELVLNFAIERKRMDDLVSSITGGRLKEQKFRLRHCGISELIILIEEYGSIQNFSISEDRIKQSLVNSQVLDGFKVKRCGSCKDAVIYLSMMTRAIQTYYGNKTLHAAPQDYVKSRSPKTTVRDKEYYLMPFETFNEASIKHKALTVKEMFGKHLIQIPGVSLERACAITQVYPSLLLLMEAYKKCTSEKCKESLLSAIKCGNKDRNLGIAISRMMYMIYNTKSLT